MILYGSRARDDNSSRSDVDILLITSENKISHTKINSLSVSFYPLDVLMEKAKSGDLFVLHLVLEGKLLFGSAAAMEEIRAAFRSKANYLEDIRSAADLGWMIARYGDEFDQHLVARRATWCVRTVLIALSVQRGQPTFSSKGLTAIAPSPQVDLLLRQKDEPVSRHTFSALQSFLTSGGYADPCPDASTPFDYYSQFERTDNVVALKLLASKHLKDDSDEYGSR